MRSLELYARIKGLAEADVPGVVQAAIAQMDLGAFANKLAQSLSGGNKRKLSVAIALIGDVRFPETALSRVRGAPLSLSPPLRPPPRACATAPCRLP